MLQFYNNFQPRKFNLVKKIVYGQIRAATRKALRMVRHETNLEPAITLRDVDAMSTSSRGMTPVTISGVHNACSHDILIGGAFPLTVIGIFLMFL